MSLFEFTADQVIIRKDLQQIHPFDKIIKKKSWEKDIAFIYHMVDYSSPYSIFSGEEREKHVKEAVYGKEDAKISKDIQEGINVYKELSKTDSLLLLESARKAIHKLRDYFDNISFEELEPDDRGDEAKKLSANLQTVGKLISSIKEWEEQVKKEKEQNTTRKGVKTTKYNVG